MVNFLAFDLETTGFSPERDRIVEIGAVLFDSRGKILHEYHSLINPKIRVRATEIHGIHDSDVIDAPDFTAILPSLTEVLNGTILVAHNKSFDLSFLLHELRRAGIRQGEIDGICTIELASRYTPNSPRKLMECCVSLGLPIYEGHRALNDARMTAHLASHLLKKAKGLRFPESTEVGLPSSIRQQGRQPFPRDAVYLDVLEKGVYLSSLVSKLPVGDGGGDAGGNQYLELLDKAISSRTMSKKVASDLVGLAAVLSLGQKKILRLHLEYFRRLCEVARADHYISNRERAELKAAALFLQIDGWESIVDQPTGVTLWEKGIPRFSEPQARVSKSNFADLERKTDFADPRVKGLLQNKSISVTGKFSEFSRDQAHEAIRKRGGRVPDKPSRRTFAIVAGQESGPRKLEEAAEWGVPILNVAEFLVLLETGQVPRRQK